jgi:hypothetical protein
MNTLNHCFLYKIIDLGYVQPEAVPDAAQKLVHVEEPATWTPTVPIISKRYSPTNAPLSA